jgi:hypothetical protein
MKTDEQTKKQIADWVNTLAKQNGGRLTPALIVSAAGDDPESPAYAWFEWDDATAAYQHRLDQARSLIRWVGVRIVEETKTVSAVSYIRDPDAGEEQGYVSIKLLKTRRNSALEALRYEVSRAVGYLERARLIADELGLSEQFDRLFEELTEIRRKADSE